MGLVSPGSKFVRFLPWLTRRNAAWWALPLVVLAAWLFASTDYLRYGLADYAQDTTANAVGTIRVIGPICAICTAVELGRIHRASAALYGAVRSPTVIAWNRFWPTLAVGSIGYVVAYGYLSSLTRSGFRIPNLSIMLVGLLALAAYSCFGVVAGRFLPTALAVAIAPLAVYFAVGFPFIGTPYWMRQLTGDLSACCALDQQVSSPVVWSSILVSLVVVACSFLAVSLVRWWSIGIIAPVVVAAIVVASMLDSSIGPNPVEARKGSLQCLSADVDVCVWPEQADLLPRVAAQALIVRAKLRALGFSVPDHADETLSIVPTTASYWKFGLDPGASDIEIRKALVNGLLPQTDCSSFGDWLTLFPAMSGAVGIALRPEDGAPSAIAQRSVSTAVVDMYRSYMSSTLNCAGS